MPKILLVEDDRDLSLEISACLESMKMTVETVYSVQNAREYAMHASYDLMILDWNLPDGTGPVLLRDLRRQGFSIPVLMLTARQEVLEKVEGFQSGADDYLTKPFHFDELMARINSLMRRPREFREQELAIGCMKINRERCVAEVDGKALDLRRREYQILELLAVNRGQIFNADQIIDRLWPSDAEINPEVIRCHVNRLRQKLSASSERGKTLITTVYGMGYKIQD
jgi:two-component system, OmpR family, response regulator ArlR